MKVYIVLFSMLLALINLPSCKKQKDPNFGIDCRVVKINVKDKGIMHYAYDNSLRLTSISIEVNGQQQTVASINYATGKAFINYYQSSNGIATTEVNLDNLGNVIDAEAKDSSGHGIGSVSIEYNEWNEPKPTKVIINGFINGTSNLMHDTLFFTWADFDLVHLTGTSKQIAYEYNESAPAPPTRYGKGNIILLIGDIGDAAAALSENYLKIYDIGGSSQIEYAYDFDEEGKAKIIYWSTSTDQGTSSVSYQCTN